MPTPLHALIVEDSDWDAALLVRELKRGYDLTYERVETREGLAKALAEQAWDIVISDYSMPSFGAVQALEMVRDSGLDLPFIIVSGTVGEDVAVEAMRAGARDFMPKGAFKRLLPAIERELGEASLRAERRRFEDHLRQAQKVEALGQLTGGVAHDFNNLLGVMIGNLDMLMDTLDDEERNQLAGDALNAALRGAELTKRLLAVARQQPLATRVVALNERLPEMVAMLGRTLGENIQIKTALASDLWEAKVDPSQVEEALLNLAINARDAMPDGGVIAIELANFHLDEHYPAIHSDIVPGDYVVLSVTDTGEGMPAEIIQRATEPFFTTKPLGKGTGLGLSMIYGFVKQSGGHLSIYSEVGVGTTVRLYLPKAGRGDGKETEAAAGAGHAPRGGESILVVDDNVELRRITLRHLKGLGYVCREAGAGPEALALLESGERFDLLFTDIGLPDGMLGYELARLAAERQPGIKVLYCTGYAKARGAQNEDPNDSTLVLRKPFRAQNLAERVRAVLDQQTERGRAEAERPNSATSRGRRA